MGGPIRAIRILTALLVSLSGIMTVVSGAAAQTELTGTRWTLTGVLGGPAMGEAWLEIAADGSVTGSSGCNAFRGTAEIEDGTIRFGPMASTRMACREGGAMEQESRLFSILSGEVAYGIGGDELTLTRPSDGSTLTYERRDE